MTYKLARTVYLHTYKQSIQFTKPNDSVKYKHQYYITWHLAFFCSTSILNGLGACTCEVSLFLFSLSLSLSSLPAIFLWEYLHGRP